VKCAYTPPAWADLYLCAGLNLAGGREELASAQFRQLIEMLDKKPTEPCSTPTSEAPETK
jgi:hypothetical protein